MTRENIARDLKPLEWDIWENGRYCYANINDTYEAMILEKREDDSSSRSTRSEGSTHV